MGGAEVWEEEHAGIFDYLQLDWRVERGEYAGVGSGDCEPGGWETAVQSVVSLFAAGVCDLDVDHGDHIPECECPTFFY